MRWLLRAAIVAQIIGWVDIALFFIGLPGYIDDTKTWARWVALVVSPPILAVAICFAISGPLLWTSGWWFPRLPRRKRRLTAPLTAMPVLNQPDEDLVRFRECLPQLELCQELVGQYASPLGGLNMGIMKLHYLFTGDTRMIKLIRELDYLTRSLNALGIRCPSVYGGNDESDSDFRVRLRIWNMHLAELAVMIPHDDLVRARQLEPPDPTKPPTSDKSDAL